MISINVTENNLGKLADLQLLNQDNAYMNNTNTNDLDSDEDCIIIDDKGKQLLKQTNIAADSSDADEVITDGIALKYKVIRWIRLDVENCEAWYGETQLLERHSMPLPMWESQKRAYVPSLRRLRSIQAETAAAGKASPASDTGFDIGTNISRLNQTLVTGTHTSLGTATGPCILVVVASDASADPAAPALLPVPSLSPLSAPPVPELAPLSMPASYAVPAPLLVAAEKAEVLKQAASLPPERADYMMYPWHSPEADMNADLYPRAPGDAPVLVGVPKLNTRPLVKIRLGGTGKAKQASMPKLKKLRVRISKSTVCRALKKQLMGSPKDLTTSLIQTGEYKSTNEKYGAVDMDIDTELCGWLAKEISSEQ